jgi:hypothetical protein
MKPSNHAAEASGKSCGGPAFYCRMELLPSTGVVLGIYQGVDGLLPGAFAQIVIAGNEKGLGHLQVEGRLPYGLILHQDDLGGLVGVLDAKTFPSACLGIERLEHAAPQSTLDEPEPVFHNEDTGEQIHRVQE